MLKTSNPALTAACGDISAPNVLPVMSPIITDSIASEPPSLVQADVLKALLGGVSDMWLWRRLRDGTLPKPLLISNRRFWRRDEIADYINRQSDARSSTGVAA
jgi:predicted DNA-binding transcriptional regulator AlpA